MFIILEKYHPDGQRLVESGVGTSGDDRPHYGGGWAVRREVHDWLISHAVCYQLHWMRRQKNDGVFLGSMPREGVWEIEVDDQAMTDDLRMLFQLKFL